MRERIEGEIRPRTPARQEVGGPGWQAGVLGSVGDSAGTHHSAMPAACSLGQQDPLNRGALAHCCVVDMESAGRDRHSLSSICYCCSRKVDDTGFPRSRGFSGPWTFRSWPNLGSVGGGTGPVDLVGTFTLCV